MSWDTQTKSSVPASYQIKKFMLAFPTFLFIDVDFDCLRQKHWKNETDYNVRKIKYFCLLWTYEELTLKEESKEN